MFGMLFRNYPFLGAALVFFVLVSIVGIVEEGFIVGIGIGLAVSVIFIFLCMTAVCAILGGLFWLDNKA